MFKLVKIKGRSMEPTLFDGEIAITIKPRHIKAGLIYLINHSELGRIVKRIGEAKNGRYPLYGDNAQSTPPAVMGNVEKERILRRLIWVIGKNGLRRIR